ncbi:MAG: hypothetical protein RJA09_2920 [Pseudomonadota bacterium]
MWFQRLTALGPALRRGLCGVGVGLGFLVGEAAWAQTAPLPGEALAQARCAACHGATGQSAAPGFPRLAGQNARYLVKQLQDFGSGRRDSAIMKEKVAGLAPGQLEAIAQFYQAQKPTVTPAKDAGLAQVGSFVYERGNPHSGVPACLSCHGTGGRGTAALPRLAGQHPQYLVRQMQAFAAKHRQNDGAIMSVIAGRLTALETEAVAEYLGGLQ